MGKCNYFDVEEIIFIGSWELWALNFNSSYNQSKPNPSHLYLAASHHATPICKTFPIFHLTIAPPDSNMYSQIPATSSQLQPCYIEAIYIRNSSHFPPTIIPVPSQLIQEPDWKKGEPTLQFHIQFHPIHFIPE